MRQYHPWNIRRFGWSLASIAALGAAGAASAAPLPPDPVEELKQAINNREGEKVLQQRVAELHTLRDLSRALEFVQFRMSSTTLEAARADAAASRVIDALARRFGEAAIAVLEKGTPDDRAAAASLVGELAPKAGQPESASVVVRRAVAAVVRPLARDVEDHDAHVRRAAIFALGKLPPLDAGPDGTPIWQIILPALKRAARVGDATQRLAASEALGNMFQTTQGSVANNVPQAAQFLEESLPAAVAGMQDPDPNVRRTNLDNFRKSVVALTALIGQLPALASIQEPKRRPEDTDAIFQTKQDSYRADIESARRVGRLTEAVATHVPALTRLATDPDVTIRVAVLKAFAELATANNQWHAKREGEAPARFGGSSTTLLGTASDDVQLVGREETAPPEIDQLPKDAVGAALTKQLPVLAAALSDPIVRVRLDALDALESSGLDLKPVAPALTVALQDPDRFVRWAAARTLGRIGAPAAAPAVPGIAALLRDPDLDVRSASAQALERIGPAAKDAVPALGAAVHDGDPEFRIAVMHALTGIGTDAVSVLPDVAGELSSPDVRVRLAAAETLGRFGPLAGGARDALRAAMNDPDAGVRRAAEEALLSLTVSPSK